MPTVGPIDDVEGIDDVVETEQGCRLDEFVWVIRPALKWRQASRNRLPDEVDCVSTSCRWAHSSRLNGTARSSRDAAVAPDSARVRIDFANANL